MRFPRWLLDLLLLAAVYGAAAYWGVYVCEWC